VDLLYQNQDPIRIARDFFKALDIDLAAVIQRSDLNKKKAKESEAYKILVDREYDYSLLLKPAVRRWEGRQDYDVRIVMNVAPNADSMSILLHEMGHAAYFENIDKKLPYVLRQEANIAMSEGVAIFFGSLIYDPRWLESFLGAPSDYLQAHQVDLRRGQIFEQLASLLQQVCHLRFEQALYENPEQDLNALWRKLVERFQGIKVPREWDNPDFLYYFDFVQWPVYKQNFIYAFLLSSHIRHYLETCFALNGISPGRFDWPAVGRFFKEKLFSLGATYPWGELLEKATGEKLNPAHFFSRFTDIQD
jgi:oligoendopeptidase F